MKTWKIAMIGFGTVGQGLAEILLAKEQSLKDEEGFACSVVAVSDLRLGSVLAPSGIDLKEALRMVKEGKSLDGYPGGKGGLDAAATIRETNADVLVEIGYTDIRTGEPATSHVRQALARGMHVVTTNKGPVALFLPDLLDLARSKGVRFLFEGTVMSGTPVLSFAKKNLAGCRVLSFSGILNGTTNYMLTEMEKGMGYDEILKKAQELGYAEAVPDADVKGWDALGKVVILSNYVLGARVKPSDIPCEGITEITPEKMKKAASEGKRYKLIGRASIDGGRVQASVAPATLPLSDPLAGVSGPTNAVTFETDLLGSVTVVGPGAGRAATGFAVLADLIDIHRSCGK
jgi:homoserine dehydrogenase